jgi:hypothetical protein
MICIHIFSDPEVRMTTEMWNKSKNKKHTYKQGCTNPGCQVTMATTFCMVAPSICGCTVWNLLLVTLLMHTNLRQLLHSWKICEPLHTNTVQCIILCNVPLNSHTYITDKLYLLLLVFSPWASLRRNQSPVRQPVWPWYAASWASS